MTTYTVTYHATEHDARVEHRLRTGREEGSDNYVPGTGDVFAANVAKHGREFVGLWARMVPMGGGHIGVEFVR